MFNLLTVGFEFKENFYYALVREKPKNTGTVYEVTVMNGRLEKLLYGNHVIHYINYHLEFETSEATEQELLKCAIAEALSKFLSIPLKKKVRTNITKRPAEMPASALY